MTSIAQNVFTSINAELPSGKIIMALLKDCTITEIMVLKVVTSKTKTLFLNKTYIKLTIEFLGKTPYKLKILINIMNKISFC